MSVLKVADIKALVKKEKLKEEFNKQYESNKKHPRLIYVSMQEALNELKITNTTIKVGTKTLEALCQWIDA